MSEKKVISRLQSRFSGLLRAENDAPISVLRRPFRLRSGFRFGPYGGPPACRSSQGGYAMRTFDLAPLYRSTVGFDRLFSMMDGFDAAPGYPPYNIERTGENDYRVTVAVAGFADNELSVEAKENTLTIKGAKQAKEEQNGEVLYQGIAARAFEPRVPACRLRPGQGCCPRERIA